MESNNSDWMHCLFPKKKQLNLVGTSQKRNTTQLSWNEMSKWQEILYKH